MSITKEKLGKMTKQELCDYCRSHKIKGYSGKTKQQRIDLILEHSAFVRKPKQKVLTQKQIINIKLVNYKSDIQTDIYSHDFIIQGSAYLILEKTKIKVKFDGKGLYDYENRQYISLDVIVSNPDYVIDDYNQTETFKKIFKEILKDKGIY